MDTSVLALSLTNVHQQPILAMMPHCFLQGKEAYFLAVMHFEQSFLIYFEAARICQPRTVKKSFIFQQRTGSCTAHCPFAFDSLFNCCLWLSLHWMMHVCICGIAPFNWLSVALAGKECRRMLPPVSPIKPRSEDKGTMQRWKFLSTLKLWRHAVSSEVARAMDENEHESSAFHPCSHVRWSPLGLAPIPDLPSYTHNSSVLLGCHYPPSFFPPLCLW